MGAFVTLLLGSKSSGICLSALASPELLLNTSSDDAIPVDFFPTSSWRCVTTDILAPVGFTAQELLCHSFRALENVGPECWTPTACLQHKLGSTDAISRSKEHAWSCWTKINLNQR